MEKAICNSIGKHNECKNCGASKIHYNTCCEPCGFVPEAKCHIINEHALWFVERIGKIVFRNKVSCQCNTCNLVYNNGVLITNLLHANYIADAVISHTANGSVLKYFDSIEHRNQFEKNLKNEYFKFFYSKLNTEIAEETKKLRQIEQYDLRSVYREIRTKFPTMSYNEDYQLCGKNLCYAAQEFLNDTTNWSW